MRVLIQLRPPSEVPLDPAEGIYALLVSAEAGSRISASADGEAGGPYANPPIEPFGPPESPER